MERRMRVLLTKMGPDPHDRGIKIVARALRDAGFEVILGEEFPLAETIVTTAVQEDVDIIGLSMLAGGYMAWVPRLFDLLKAREAGEIVVTMGGIVAPEHVESLRSIGVRDVFGPGTSTGIIVEAFKRYLPQKVA